MKGMNFLFYLNLSIEYSAKSYEYFQVYMATRLFLNISQSYIPFYIQDSLRVQVSIKWMILCSGMLCSSETNKHVLLCLRWLKDQLFCASMHMSVQSKHVMSLYILEFKKPKGWQYLDDLLLCTLLCQYNKTCLSISQKPKGCRQLNDLRCIALCHLWI